VHQGWNDALDAAVSVLTGIWNEHIKMADVTKTIRALKTQPQAPKDDAQPVRSSGK